MFPGEISSNRKICFLVFLGIFIFLQDHAICVSPTFPAGHYSVDYTDESAEIEKVFDEPTDEDGGILLNDLLLPEELTQHGFEGGEADEVLKRYRVHTRARPWMDAVTACWREGGRLATPEDASEAKLLGRLLTVVANTNITNTEMKDAMFIGMFSFNMEGNMKTLEGVEPKYTNWLSGKFQNFIYRSKCGAVLADGHYIGTACSGNLTYACDTKAPTQDAKEDTESKPGVAAEAYERVGDEGLFRVNSRPLTWLEAAAACAAEGAALAVPAGGRQAGFVAGAVFAHASDTARKGLFIGITDVTEEGQWVDFKGNFVNLHEMWANGRPNGKRASNCGAILPTGHYIDVPCWEPRPFLCQRQLDAASEAAEFVAVEGVGRYALFASPKPWLQAAILCRAFNATLAVPDSKEEAMAMQKIVRESLKDSPGADGQDVFIGAQDMDLDGKWLTVHGKRLRNTGFNEWNAPEKSMSFNIKMCGVLRNGKYTNCQCSTLRPYICEKPL